MAIRLAFVRPHAEQLLSGPYGVVRFLLDDLMADGKALASYVENRWQVQGSEERFGSVEFRSRVDVHFERKDGERSKALGPYSAFHLMDGVAYADDRVFACFDKEHEDWYSLTLGHHWPTMAVVAAAAESKQPDRVEDS